MKKYLFRNYDLPRSLLFLLLSRRNTQKSAYILWECVKNINKSYLQYQLCVLQKSDFYSSWHCNFFYLTDKYFSHVTWLMRYKGSQYGRHYLAGTQTCQFHVNRMCVRLLPVFAHNMGCIFGYLGEMYLGVKIRTVFSHTVTTV